MKFDIFDNGVFQPFEFILFLLYFGFLIFVFTFIFTVGEITLDAYPKIEEFINKPAPMWIVVLLWFLASRRQAR